MGRPDTLWFTGVICMDARDLQELVLESPATRTNHEWIQRPMDLPCCDDVQGMQPPRERGRLARIRPGKMETNPAKEGLLRFTRKRPRMAGFAPIRLREGPATAPLRPRPWRSGRRSRRVLHRREPERLATAVHAGGTPALPGGVPLPIARAPRGDSLRHGLSSISLFFVWCR